MRCEFERDVSIYLRGALSPSERARFVAHLVDCGSCAAFVASDQRDFGANAERPPRRGVPAPESRPPSRVGRYIILNLVGRGGMGDVYAAYDPRLDRKVALKLLRETPGDAPTAAATQERLLREAQATARLSHRNVVVVYDAGTFEPDGGGSRVYLAMELVEGRTLSTWLAEERRSWRQIRDLFLAAGEGLQAAHEAALVHRDFKPQNVMVGPDGAVRVMDFGLAGDAADLPPAARTAIDPSSEASPSAETIALTDTGILLGTPVYMAPEQFTGRPTDARTDQFSFCVALYEALYGERPFPSETYTALIGAVVAGRAREAPKRARVPAFLRKVLLRGLSATPDARYASMRELLLALKAEPIRYRRGVAVGAAVGAVMLVTLGGAHALATRKQAMCRAGADRLQGIWEVGGAGPRRTAVHAAFLASGSPIAEDTWNRASALLDDYSQRWTAAYTDTCEATQVRGDQSSEVLDLRMACLEGNRGALRALTEVFSRTDGRIIVEAVNAVHALPPIDRCADLASLRSAVALPARAADRARIASLEGRLAEAKALADTGQWASALRQMGPLVDAARVAAYEPLLAEALEQDAWLMTQLGREADARAVFEEEVGVALAAHRDELSAASAAELVAISAEIPRSPDEPEQWTAFAEALLQRLGPGHERVAGWLHHNRAILLVKQGHFEQATTELDLALALKRKALPANHPDIAITLYRIAYVRANLLGDGASALRAAQEAIEIQTIAYGESSPLLWSALDSRGCALETLRRYREAEEDLRASVALAKSVMGDGRSWTARPLADLGKTLLAEGKNSEAVEFLKEAARPLERDDPTSPDLAEARFALARAEWNLDADRADARALAQAASKSYRAIPGYAKWADEVDAWLAARPAASRNGLKRQRACTQRPSMLR